ncbi:hypothetical protein DXN05_11720 [Deminuibacter soli]|uniref:Uncharacterized protein n=1 Tax=Deminuibacter soli TaxID=2291815 RepID=A0A3E1NJT2_9BACT|nr:hypothetical protein DXN05_11720 [Deminuibacter soli]
MLSFVLQSIRRPAPGAAAIELCLSNGLIHNNQQKPAALPFTHRWQVQQAGCFTGWPGLGLYANCYG